ncbi:hypothetical protein BD413DRAFT_294388 [Trametes elegans]|nr:hypothetical protein BD413DRAFT_294388 [Trametes elegans]
MMNITTTKAAAREMARWDECSPIPPRRLDCTCLPVHHLNQPRRVRAPRRKQEPHSQLQPPLPTVDEPQPRPPPNIPSKHSSSLAKHPRFRRLPAPRTTGREYPFPPIDVLSLGVMAPAVRAPRTPSISPPQARPPGPLACHARLRSSLSTAP